ncbi:hypothetical protein TSUD_367980 [Trifolium subterraneum]|uniref:RNase H type-1 domain-containing protein n=1 Tax=Trifolium subterraneum TaxID=3900 RepID=A0A2Z6M4F2_TRISU|nr:hypothetical protein TSUD_367980 [Trifolium subterraneum]
MYVWKCIIWSPPPRNFLKLNVDAHLKDDGHWGLGLVLRREDGRCVGAVTRVVDGSNDAALAEAHGLQEALRWIRNLHITRVIIEIDAVVIVQAIQKREFPRTKWGRVVEWCARDFDHDSQISLKWICRQGNKAVHDLARWAFQEPNREWNTDYPHCIIRHIQKDMSHVN